MYLQPLGSEEPTQTTHSIRYSQHKLKNSQGSEMKETVDVFVSELFVCVCAGAALCGAVVEVLLSSSAEFEGGSASAAAVGLGGGAAEPDEVTEPQTKLSRDQVHRVSS